MADEEDRDVLVTLDEAAPDKSAAEPSKLDADAAGKKTPDPVVVKTEKDKPLSAEEGKEDLAEQLKAARATAEAERRGREDADRRAQEAREVAAASRNDAASTQALLITGSIDAIGLERQQAKSEYKQAMEAGDFEAAAEAQSKMADTSARLVRLQEAKAAVDTAKGRPAPAHEGRVERPTAPAQQPDAFEQVVSQLSPASQIWARQHPAYFTDEKLNRKVIAAHYAARADEIAPDSPEYFRFLEESVGIRQRDGGAAVVAAAGGGAVPRPSAPVGRDTVGGGARLDNRTVRLSAAQVEAARIAGMTNEQYARNLLELEAEGAYSPGAYAAR